jgi:hypothetical protein
VIVFDLACGAGHVFEAWFGSSGDYEDQRARGLVECPLCGDRAVTKAVMAPNVGAKGNTLPEPRPASGRPVPMQAGGPPAPAAIKALLARLAEAQAQVLARSEHVGRRFAAEARAIHEGDAPERPIHGQATLAEARALVEDGVEVAPLPLPLPIVPAGEAH